MQLRTIKVLTSCLFVLNFLADHSPPSEQQLMHLRDWVQRRIWKSEEPLVEIYKVLRRDSLSILLIIAVDTFSLSLQLYILYSQALSLSKQKSTFGSIRVEYETDSKLTIHYWNQQDM